MLHLATQRALADGRDAKAEVGKGLLFRLRSELCAEAVHVAEDTVVDHADQAVQLQQRVLKGRGGQQHLGMNVCQRVLEHLGDDVAGLVDIAQAVRFIEHHEVPVNGLDVISLGLGELVGADHRAGQRGAREDEGIRLVLLAQRVVVLGLQDQAVQVELVLQFLMPLLAQVGRHDDEDAAPALGPALRDDEAGLDRLAQTHLIGQDDTA